ncbi:leucine-rich repeat protein, partial [Anaerobutyricum hallii]|uniref:leucine-rich repeat protein n=1 Tax=Anaerobutyricum hallii TaxID=39488 RepID=UPI001ADDB729
PEMGKDIGSQCVESDKELVNVKMSSTIKRKERGAFGNCTSLTEITIPKSLEEAGREYRFRRYDYGQFCGCTNLKTFI